MLYIKVESHSVKTELIINQFATMDLITMVIITVYVNT